MGKFLRAAVCTAAVSVGAMSLSGCNNYTKMMNETPDEYISMASENTMEQMVKGAFGEEVQFIGDAAENGSFILEFEVEGIKYKGEAYINEKDNLSAQTYTLTGSKGTSAQVYAFADNDKLKIGTNGKSGSHIYDVVYETFEEKLAASIFAPNSGGDYALSQEDYDMLIEYAKEINGAISGTEEAENNKYAEIIDAYTEANPPVIQEKIDSDIGGETAQANIITYTISKESLYDLVNKFTDLVLDEYEKSNGFTEDYTKEDMKTEIMGVFDELNDYGLSIVYYINSETHVLMKSETDLVLETKANENYGTEAEKMNIYVDAVYGADPANAVERKFALGMISGEEVMGIDFDITYAESNSIIKIVLTDGEEVTEAATITNKRDGESYSITLSIPELDVTGTVDGTIKNDENSFVLTVDKLALVEGAGEISYAPKGVITVTKGGTMPALEAEKEFLDITNEEMDALAENIENDFTAVLNEVAEDSPVAGAMTGYIDESRAASANANAKMCFTAIAAELTRMAIDGETISGTVVEGSGATAVIGGAEKKMTDYLGDSFEGYYYAEIEPDIFSINFAVWSDEPIPDEYKRTLSDDEQKELIGNGTFIGCYPINY